MENNIVKIVKNELLSTEQLLDRKNKIQDIQKKVMRLGVDFGVIEGCKKPSLWKAGAEILNLTFGFTVILKNEDIETVDLNNGHREYRVRVHIMRGDREVATGVGSCSTMEKKYRWTTAAIECPICGKAAIIQGKAEYGGGWICFLKKGGCGLKFKAGDERIKGSGEKIENDNLADFYNTCLKMAKKRALIDGTISATAASHIFTQDIEDIEAEVLQDTAYRVVEVSNSTLKEKLQMEKKEPAPEVAPQLKPAPEPDFLADCEQEKQEQKEMEIKVQKQEVKKQLSEAQVKRLYAIAKSAGWDNEAIKIALKNNYKVEHSKDLTREQYDIFCDFLQGKNYIK